MLSVVVPKRMICNQEITKSPFLSKQIRKKKIAEGRSREQGYPVALEGGTTADADAHVDALRHAMRAAALLTKSRQPVRSRPLIVDMDPTPADEFDTDDLGVTNVQATYLGKGTTIAALRAELLVPIMSAAEAERSEALLLPAFLTDAEICLIFKAAETMPFPAGAQKEVQSDYSAGTGTHVALNMHKDGYFARGWPALLEKLRHGMESQPGRWAEPGAALGLRCIEFHTYKEGGGLMMKDHRDYGSVLTLSVLLSHPAAEGVSAEGVSADETRRLRQAARSKKKKLKRQLKKWEEKKASESNQEESGVGCEVTAGEGGGGDGGEEEGEEGGGGGLRGGGGLGGGGTVAPHGLLGEADATVPTSDAPDVPNMPDAPDVPDAPDATDAPEAPGPVATPEAGAAPPADGFCGGQFLTWLVGEPVVHRMARGDALLFHSEKVSTLSTL